MLSGSGPLLTRRNRPGRIGITPSTAAGRANRLSSDAPNGQSMRTSTSHHGAGSVVPRNGSPSAWRTVLCAPSAPIRQGVSRQSVCRRPAQRRARPIRSRFRPVNSVDHSHHRAVLGQALLEDPLGLRLEQGEHEVVAMRHPRELDRREQALAAVEAEAVQAQTTCQKALGHARCLHQLERPR